MSVPIVLPDLGADGDLLRVTCWLVEPGESVDAGERIVEVLAPGVTFDVAAPCSGVLERVVKAIDAPVAAGEVLGWIEQDQPEVDET